MGFDRKTGEQLVRIIKSPGAIFRNSGFLCTNHFVPANDGRVKSRNWASQEIHKQGLADRNSPLLRVLDASAWIFPFSVPDPATSNALISDPQFAIRNQRSMYISIF